MITNIQLLFTPCVLPDKEVVIHRAWYTHLTIQVFGIRTFYLPIFTIDIKYGFTGIIIILEQTYDSL